MAKESNSVTAIQQAIKESGAEWSAAPNELTELNEAQKKLRLGYTPGPNDKSLEEQEAISALNAVPKDSAISGGVGYPTTFDLRNVSGSNFITPVKDQGGCGSCVAFGVIATAEGTLRKQLNNAAFAVDFSEAHLFYCHARSEGRRCSGASGGWWPEKALIAFKDKGVVDEACYPYTSGDQSCGACSDWANKVTKITAWHNLTNIAKMKEWISTKGPLVACFTVYDDFFSYSSGVYRHVTGDAVGGHCVSVVGYNDTARYWICKNSWGTARGESGFFRIAYGQCGIDSNMQAIDGISDPVWINNKRVIGLWAIDQDRNAWAYIDTYGWRRISFDNDNIFFNMLIQLQAAKASNALVSFRMESNVIKEIYVN